jgi:uncharacterized protein YjbJ (UPF0337 family)
MDKDRIKGKAKDIAGKAQEQWGRATNQPEHELKGKDKQVEGKAQNTWGNVKDTAREALD